MKPTSFVPQLLLAFTLQQPAVFAAPLTNPLLGNYLGSAPTQQGNPAAGILNRFEQGIPGGLTTTQRDQIRQSAESYVRDRASNGEAAQKQFETTLQAVLNPSVYNDTYLANRAYFLNGQGRMNGSAPTSSRLAQQGSQNMAAGILNRFEQGIPGGLTTTQRDQIRQSAESYVRDRASNGEAAQKQFETTLQAVLNPSVYNDTYLANRTYFLSGQGQRPQTGARTGPQQASAVLTRFERGIPGGLTTTQRDQIRQSAESYVRDRASNGEAAQKQFETTLQAVLNPSVYNDIYLANRAYFLNGQGRMR